VSTAWAGAERRQERRSSSPLRLSFLLVIIAGLASVAVGCGSQREAPSALLDGSPVQKPPVQLEGVDSQVVMTRFVVTAAAGVVPGSAEASCLAGRARGADAIGAIVTRTGVRGESVTMRERGAVVGCDGTRSARRGRRWCGGSYGRLSHGRLPDPRLDIAGCRTTAGDPVAFVWIEPRRDAHYVVVSETGYSEAYSVERGLPVRVSTTSGIHSDPLGATLVVTEHDASGRLLRRYRLMARPAG
jgi:hypothetical protein